MVCKLFWECRPRFHHIFSKKASLWQGQFQCFALNLPQKTENPTTMVSASHIYPTTVLPYYSGKHLR